MSRLPASNSSKRFICATHFEGFDSTEVTYLAFDWSSTNFDGTTFINTSLTVELQVAMIVRYRRVTFLISVTLN